MLFKHHPSEALILSVLNGTAPAAEQKLVSDHVARCPRCQSVSAQKRVLLQELGELSRSSSSKREPLSPSNTLLFPQRRSSKVFAPKIVWGAIAAALVIGIFAWPRHIQSVSAAELLSRAEATEVDTTASQHFYRLHVGTATCETSDPYWEQSSGPGDSPCERVHGQLLQARWDDRQMLSAHSYRQWHDGLLSHRDSVLHEEPYWTIKTDTDQGLLRSASLRVRSSDYRPVELTLIFAALEPVSVMEDIPQKRRIYVPPVTSEKLTKNEDLQHVDGPGDAIEVQAWNLLRTLGADSGWEATITRKGGEVRVVGLIRDKARQEKFDTAFSNLQGVTMALDQPALLPQRGGDGEGQPLAENLLETLIPDAHERGERVTEISDASRAVVGKAYLHDLLVGRRHTLQGSPSAPGLNTLINEEQGDLLAATARLSDLLEPLIETKVSHGLHEPLSYAQARKLDAAVLSLVNAAPRQSASLEETKGIVLTLLSKN
jgi:hypothetical protein